MTEQEWLNEFGNNLARLMYEYKLTQKDVADMTGISPATISKYLNKQQMPGMKSILDLSYLFSCDVSDLVDFGRKISK